jgi:hypothetical protein
MNARIKASMALLPLFVTIVSLQAAALSFSDGGANGGGGDLCEDRIKVITQDLTAWLVGGGPLKLNLATPEGRQISAEDVQSRMLKEIQKAPRVSCVGPGDQGYPVLVNGYPKECKSEVSPQGATRIICDREKFYSGLKDPENDPNQYRIVYHEFATLAGLEVPNQDDSNYFFSDQITGFLENHYVARLVLRRPDMRDRPDQAFEERAVNAALIAKGLPQMTSHVSFNPLASPYDVGLGGLLGGIAMALEKAGIIKGEGNYEYYLPRKVSYYFVDHEGEQWVASCTVRMWRSKINTNRFLIFSHSCNVVSTISRFIPGSEKVTEEFGALVELGSNKSVRSVVLKTRKEIEGIPTDKIFNP